MGAFSRSRRQLAFAADRLQHIEAALPRRSAPLHVEDRTRQRVDFRLDALDEVSHAIGDGFDQTDEHRRPVGESWIRLAAARAENRERKRLRIAHRDQPVASEDEVIGVVAGSEVSV